MVSETVLRCTLNVTPHYWSAPEIMKMCEVSGKSTRERYAGVVGRRAENHARRRLGNTLEQGQGRDQPVQAQGHRRSVDGRSTKRRTGSGSMTTATMMYGHVENDEDIVESFEHIRNVQDRSEGRTGRVHCVHSVVLQARQHRSFQKGGHGSRRQPLHPPHRPLPNLPRQRAAYPGVVVLRRPKDWAKSPCSSARTILAARCSTKTSCSPPVSTTARTSTKLGS